MNRVEKKKMIPFVILFLALLCCFIVCRYLLFDWHGMKEFPNLLFGLGCIFLLISTAIQAREIATCVVLGYIFGFFGGKFLHSYGIDPGGGSMSNWWIIWCGVFFFFVLLGALVWKVKKYKLR